MFSGLASSGYIYIYIYIYTEQNAKRRLGERMVLRQLRVICLEYLRFSRHGISEFVINLIEWVYYSGSCDWEPDMIIARI